MSAYTLTVFEEVVIAGGYSERRSRALAGVQLLPDGDLLVGYREGTDHLITDDGAVMTMRSHDGGRTWNEPRAVFALPGWDCAGGSRIVQLPDRSLLMFVFQARWRRENEGEPVREAHVFPTRSVDGGLTWGEFEPELRLFEGWCEPYAHGHMQVLSDGRWLIPVHGADRLGGRTYSAVAFSKDGGVTWGERAIVARSEDVNFYETDIIRLEDGRLLAVIRTQDTPFASYQAYSDDEGRTWTALARTGFYGQTPRLFRLRSGMLLCAYRERDPARPGVSYSISDADGKSWQFGGQLYQARDWNCGYPDLVRLPSGELFCVFYALCHDGGSEVHGLFLHENG
jgi:hypothetical protein